MMAPTMMQTATTMAMPLELKPAVAVVISSGGLCAVPWSPAALDALTRVM